MDNISNNPFEIPNQSSEFVDYEDYTVTKTDEFADASFRKRSHSPEEEGWIALELFDLHTFQQITFEGPESLTIAEILDQVALVRNVAVETLSIKRRIRKDDTRFTHNAYVEIPSDDLASWHLGAFSRFQGGIIESTPVPKEVVKNEMDDEFLNGTIKFLTFAGKHTLEERKAVFQQLINAFWTAHSNFPEEDIKEEFFQVYFKASGTILNLAYKEILADYMKEKYSYFEEKITQEVRFIPKDSFAKEEAYETIIDENLTKETDIIENRTHEYMRDHIRSKQLEKKMRAPSYTFVLPDSKDPIHIEAFDNFVNKLKDSIATDFNFLIDDKICREYARNALNEIIRDHFKNQE